MSELPWEAILGWLPRLGLWDEPLLCLCLLCGIDPWTAVVPSF